MKFRTNLKWGMSSKLDAWVLSCKIRMVFFSPFPSKAMQLLCSALLFWCIESFLDLSEFQCCKGVTYIPNQLLCCAFLFWCIRTILIPCEPSVQRPMYPYFKRTKRKNQEVWQISRDHHWKGQIITTPFTSYIWEVQLESFHWETVW
jgi:hypothetical protein